MESNFRFLWGNERYELFNVLREAKNSVKKYPCMLERYGACTSAAINSHTISASQLRLIAEYGEVRELKVDRKAESNEARFVPCLTGIKAAGTYAGFCKEHDRDLFIEIDRPVFSPNASEFQMLFMRSLGQEISKKLTLNLLFSSYFKMDENFQSTGEIELSKMRVLLGLRDNFMDFDKINHFINKGSCCVKYFCIDLNVEPFIASVGIITPETLPIYFPFPDQYDGRHFRTVMFCLLPRPEGQRIVFVWFDGESRLSRPMLDRYFVASQNLLEFAFQFSLEHCECTFIRPSFWEQLSSTGQTNALAAMDKNALEYLQYDVDWRPFEQDSSLFSYRLNRSFSNSSWAKNRYSKKLR